MAQPFPLRPAQPVCLEPSDKPTYAAHFHVSPSAAMDVLSVKAGAGRVVRIRQIVFTNLGQQTVAGLADMQFGYASDLGSGGSAHGAAHNYGFADGDGASTSTARFGDTALAPGFVSLGHLELFIPGAKTTQTPYDLQFHDHHKPPTVKGDLAAATTFVIRHPGIAGAIDLVGFVEWTEEVL